MLFTNIELAKITIFSNISKQLIEISAFFIFFLEIEQKNGIFAHAKPLIILNSYLYVFERRIDI